MAESWASSTRTSPHAAPRGPPTISPPFDSSSITRSEWRPQLPSLPALTFDRAPVTAPRAPGNWSEYGFDAASRASIQPVPLQSISPTDSTTYPPATNYAYQQPRGLSYSGPPTGHTSTHNQAPFSTIHPSGFVGYPYPVDAGDMGGDSKQRKRRGNLPKETTDTLRAWFREHLSHPYPSEEEKQRMMKATGLQMSEFPTFGVVITLPAN
jgi:Homeobox KN domain